MMMLLSTETELLGSTDSHYLALSVLCCAVLLRPPPVVTQKSILNSHCRYQFQICSGEAFMIS